MNIIDDTSASGYIDTGFEGISASFTEVEIIRTGEFNVLARAKRYGKWWMLKGVSPKAAGNMAHIQMLRKEFETIMSLNCPAVVQAVSLEPVGDLGMCIVMEYVEGKTLNGFLETNPPKCERLRIVAQLLDAVEYIHSYGIAHRDLKPSNIMVADNGGGVKIIDLGLADSDRNAILKQPGGTRRYMSPEQETQSECDVRNDIYSLGVILQDMNLGWKYRHIAARCVLPIDKRYQSIADLKEAFRRIDRLGIIAARSVYALIIVAAALAVWLGRATGSGTASQIEIDSLHNVIATTRAGIDSVKINATHQIDSMQALLSGTQAQIAEMNRLDSIENAKTEALNRLVNAGYAVLERKWKTNLAKFNSMTIEEQKKCALDLLQNELYEAANKYADSLRNSQSQEVVDFVHKKVTDRMTFYYQPQITKMITQLYNGEQ
ncbi:MAG: serine/threonine protein kinase [Muribaculaceae bacterium]